MTLEIPLNKKHIVIEGPIGVGKSSLCRKIVEHCGGYLYLEKPAENPFLASFYKRKEQFALATQLFFLMQRLEQREELKSLETTGVVNQVVADFMIEKDPLFAELILSGDELSLYRKVFDRVCVQKTKPDLVVFLQAPVDVLKKRIKRKMRRKRRKSTGKKRKIFSKNISVKNIH
ncbi:MAG: deoxynucleoside kinase [Gammaproteobacteria bacterium]|nr:deoxynucleoside kinase [Gammaproteobacteria bacterium]